jgi:hypothetical protein
VDIKRKENQAEELKKTALLKEAAEGGRRVAGWKKREK